MSFACSCDRTINQSVYVNKFKVKNAVNSGAVNITSWDKGYFAELTWSSLCEYDADPYRSDSLEFSKPGHRCPT